MSDRLFKESDVLRIAFQLPFVVNSAFVDAVKALPSESRVGIRREGFKEGFNEGMLYERRFAEKEQFYFCEKCGKEKIMLLK